MTKRQAQDMNKMVYALPDGLSRLRMQILVWAEFFKAIEKDPTLARSLSEIALELHAIPSLPKGE
jgi:hypothetical protein